MSTNLVRPIREENFHDEVLNSPVPVLLDFATAWCGPCRAMMPILHKFAEETRERVKILSVAADECPALAARFSIRGYPTVIAFANGRERARHFGTTTREKLVEMVEACQ